jgi:hypothetical protein
VPPDLTLNEAMVAFAAKKGMAPATMADELEGFIAYHMKEGKLSASWEASWQTWVRNHFKFKAEKAAAERPPGKDPKWEGIV